MSEENVISTTPAEQVAPPLPPPPPAPATALEAEVTPSQQIDSLQTSLSAHISETIAAKKAIDQKQADLIALQGSHDSAVTAYRKLLISSNPLFTEELISGATISELDAAAKKTTDLATQVRAKLEADIKSNTIPAGAPARSGPDTSGLTAREKIYHAVEQNNTKQ